MKMTTRLVAAAVLVLVAMSVVACSPGMQDYTYLAAEQYPAKAKDAHIDVYVFESADDRSKITKEFTILATFTFRSQGDLTGATEKAEKKAREIGGDAVTLGPPRAMGWGTKSEPDAVMPEIDNTMRVAVLKYKS